MILMIQWPPRHVTSYVNNSYKYLKMSLKHNQRNISHTINVDDYLLTDAINHRLMGEMELQSHYSSTCWFTRRVIHKVGDDMQANAATVHDETSWRSARMRQSTKGSDRRLDESHTRMGSALWVMSTPPAMSAYERDKPSTPKEAKEINSTWRMKRTYNKEWLPNRKCTAVKVRLKIQYWNETPSTNQTHVRRWNTYKWKSWHIPGALTVETMTPPKINWDDCEWDKERDELRGSSSKATIQNSWAWGTNTVVYTPAFRETKVSLQYPMYGRGMICMLSGPGVPLWRKNERYSNRERDDWRCKS